MLLTDISRLLTREIDALQRELELFPGEESVWRVVPGVTNSAGTLSLHIAGNLQHFIGAVLGGSGYVRDRGAEFAAQGIPRADLRRGLQEAREVVTVTLPGLDPAILSDAFPAAPGGITIRTELFLLHLIAHTAFHLGQVGYLRRIVTGDTTSAVPVAVAALVEPST